MNTPDEGREIQPMQWTNEKVMAVDALARLGDEPAIKLLIRALALESWHLRNRVVKALQAVGKPAVPHLIENLNSGQWFVREGASIALGNIGDVRAIEPLLELLSDRNKSVTEAAKKAISQISTRHSSLLRSDEGAGLPRDQSSPVSDGKLPGATAEP